MRCSWAWTTNCSNWAAGRRVPGRAGGSGAPGGGHRPVRVQVGLARKRLGERIAAGTAEIVHGDAAALPWPDASFTVVTCMSVFEAFPDPCGVVDEVFRVLRPGGRAVLNIGERVEPGTQTHRVLNDSAWVWAEDDVRSMVEEAGFADVTIQYVPWGEDTTVNRLVRQGGGRWRTDHRRPAPGPRHQTVAGLRGAWRTGRHAQTEAIRLDNARGMACSSYRQAQGPHLPHIAANRARQAGIAAPRWMRHPAWGATR